MMLADMLALASRKVKLPGIIHESALNEVSPRLVIDFATLTGQGYMPLVCMYSMYE